MRIVANDSSYDTRAIRRVMQAVARELSARESGIRGIWPRVRVRVSASRAQKVRVVFGSEITEFNVLLPQLRGSEFINLLREQHGGDAQAQHGGVATLVLALQTQARLYDAVGLRSRGWHSKTLLYEQRTMRGLPGWLPLKMIKPEAPRDKLQERLARTVELRKNWQRKAKLAATKLKKLASQQKRYEKQLAQREVAQ